MSISSVPERLRVFFVSSLTCLHTADPSPKSSPRPRRQSPGPRSTRRSGYRVVCILNGSAFRGTYASRLARWGYLVRECILSSWHGAILPAPGPFPSGIAEQGRRRRGLRDNSRTTPDLEVFTLVCRDGLLSQPLSSCTAVLICFCKCALPRPRRLAVPRSRRTKAGPAAPVEVLGLSAMTSCTRRLPPL